MSRPQLSSSILSRLRTYLALRSIVLLLCGAGWAIALGGAIFLLGCIADRLLQLPPTSRLLLLVMAVMASLVALARPILRMIGSVSPWLTAAGEIEHASGIFSQRLETVVSQSLEDARYRGSPQLLRELAEGLVPPLATANPLAWVRWRRLLRPTALALATAGLFGSLWSVRWLEMPTLSVRMVRPFERIAPVTYTRITVGPGDASRNRGERIEIVATVSRLEGLPPEIYTSQTRQSWTRIPMQPVGEGRYGFTLSQLERDVWYYVKGGDATTPQYKVTVLRPPGVLEYRIRYEYPAYTGRVSQTISCTDGAVDAVVGTKVTLDVVATEAVTSASLNMGGRKQPMAAADGANVRRAQFTIQGGQSGEVEIAGPGGRTRAPISIHAQPDREPSARLVEPAEDLRLSPRDLLPVYYEAEDDYGLASVALSLQVNNGATIMAPLAIEGDVRRQEARVGIDLADLRLAAGDLLKLSLRAQDGSGKKVATPAVEVLIVPRSVDGRWQARLADLHASSAYVAAARDHWQAAATALEQARQAAQRSQTEHLSARLQVSRALVSAVENLAMAHQSLLRSSAGAEQGPAMLAVAGFADHVRTLMSAAERLTGADAAGAAEQDLADRLRPLLEAVVQLAPQVKVLSDAEQARLLLAERANLRVPPATQPADRARLERLRESLRRGYQELAGRITAMGLSPDAGDLDAQLQRKLDAAARIVRPASVVEFDGAATAWAGATGRGEAGAPPLAERLLTAAAVEAVRADGDPIRARDLQLCAGRPSASPKCRPTKSGHHCWRNTPGSFGRCSASTACAAICFCPRSKCIHYRPARSAAQGWRSWPARPQSTLRRRSSRASSRRTWRCRRRRTHRCGTMHGPRRWTSGCCNRRPARASPILRCANPWTSCRPSTGSLKGNGHCEDACPRPRRQRRQLPRRPQPICPISPMRSSPWRGRSRSSIVRGGRSSRWDPRLRHAERPPGPLKRLRRFSRCIPMRWWRRDGWRTRRPMRCACPMICRGPASFRTARRWRWRWPGRRHGARRPCSGWSWPARSGRSWSPVPPWQETPTPPAAWASFSRWCGSGASRVRRQGPHHPRVPRATRRHIRRR